MRIRSLAAGLLALTLSGPALAFGTCDFSFEIDSQSSAFQALLNDAKETGGFWRPIREAPDDVLARAKFIGRLDICLMTSDGKPGIVNTSKGARSLDSPYVTSCTAALLPNNQLLTNKHCFYEPSLVKAGFTIVREARVNFGYVSKDFTDDVQTFLVANREVKMDDRTDSMVLQIIGGDANDTLGGHIPLVMEAEATPKRALTMIHHPRGLPQQYSAGTCQVHPDQSELPASATQLRHRCESAGGSSGSLLLDARTLAVVGLHNQGGLSSNGGFNGGHKISAVEAALGLGFKKAKGAEPPKPIERVPTPEELATAELTRVLQMQGDARTAGLRVLLRDHKGTAAAQSAQAMLDLIKAAQPKPDPVVRDDNILVVKANGGGDHRSLTAAVAAAKSGSVIEVHPGTYTGGVNVSKPLEIVGIGDRSRIILQTTDDDVIEWTAPRGRIANVTVRLLGGSSHAIDFKGGSAILEDSDLSSQGLSIVGVRDGANPVIRNNDIHDGAQSGIYFYNQSAGTVEGNDIYGNSNGNIAVKEDSTPVVRNNTIRDGVHAGIFVFDGGKGRFEDNVIRNNGLSGVEIKTGSAPVVRRNVIRDSGGSGFYIYEDATGVIVDNDIYGNANAGVSVKSGANPEVTDNKIRNGLAAGIVVYDSGRGVFEDNEIYANAYAGVEIKTQGDPVIRNNIFRDGQQSGVFVHTNGLGTLTGNRIYGNDNVGVFIKSEGNPIIRDNTITDNKYQAVWARAGGMGTIEDNDLRGNGRGAFDIEADAGNVIRRNNLE